MANYVWTISHSSNSGSSWTDITDLCQTWTYRYGRRAVTDQWASGGGTIEGFDPSSLPTINVGDWIEFSEGTYSTAFVLAVADFTWVYNPVATADTWTITLEDALAQIGRIYLDTDTTIPAGSLDAGTAAWGLATTYGVDFNYYGGLSITGAITAAKGTNGTQILQTLTNQAGAYIHAHRVDVGVKWMGYESLPWSGNPDGVFTITAFDDTTGNGYGEILFEGLADSYFDLVFVNAQGLDSQSAGTGVRAYAIDTYNDTEADALSWANYLLIQLGSAAQTPAQMLTLSQQWAGLIEPTAFMPGNDVTIALRGTTYYATIEGGTITATPAQTRITLSLSDREATNYLILNDTVWGKLDENRLGF